MLEERSGNGTEFAALRHLLVGPEQEQLDALADRVEQVAVTPQSLAAQLPEAIALSSSRDQQLGRALAPTVETALRESIRRNPREIATAIFPVLGPAIRKAIAETMAGLVRSINSAVEHSLSVQGIKWRVESWRTGVRYPEVVIKHALVYRVEQVFLIHAETGLLLAHVTAPDLKVPDADLISGMLTAIQDFVRDSFRPGEGGTLTGFTVGEHTVHVEAGPRALIAGVIRGQCPDAVPQRLASTLEQIHLEYAAPLTDFEGDAAPFASATPLLEQNLETVLSTDHTKSTGGAWLKWAVPLGVVVLVVLGLTTASWMRWRRAVRIIEAEPGLVLVDASRSWRRWNFRGLKDPIARDPRDVLKAAGLSPPTIDAQWKPYLSLDSSMVAARAHRTLDALRQRIEGARVLFDPASFVVADDDPTLRGLSSTILQLLDSATAGGASVHIALIGRTDPTGTDAKNQSLAQQRVDAVTRRLVAFGVPASLLQGRSLAASQPLRVGDPGEGARINRSVSFEVAVEQGSRAPRGQ
jgi:outer membrane protein OmpA-like peptidoglycan-associated protein